jgi:hypothetical protein
MANRIFVSSTVYDLLDVRAELLKLLGDLSLVPVLSDQPPSDFTLNPSVNSIETCLVNLRTCDAVLVVLSQRYGPSLGAAGYPDISATHLEYREARDCGLPIFFYVRDRLEADYSYWKKNGRPDSGLTVSWVRDQDQRLFKFMDEHSKLMAGAQNTNWYWTFRDSVDLKERVQRDLREHASKALLRRLIDAGRLPFLLANITEWRVDPASRELAFTALITNVASAAAVEVCTSIHPLGSEEPYEKTITFLQPLLAGQQTTVSFTVPLSRTEYRKRNPVLMLECAYSTIDGHYAADWMYLEFSWEARPKSFPPAIAMHRRKRYYHSSALELEVYARRENE